jgi:hypothetical protein
LIRSGFFFPLLIVDMSNGLISDVFVASGSNSVLGQTHFGPLCLSKTSKCLSEREVYFFHSSLLRCSFLSRHSSPLCPRSSVRAPPSSWRTWRCATKSACLRYLLRDRDAIFGDAFRGQVRDLGIQEVLGTPRSPWQRAHVERVIGSIRRECLDHVIVFDESSLRRILRSYLDYYHRSRTHLSLGKDSPEPRSIHPEQMGRVVALPQVGGLHHRYERRAA